MEVFRIEVPEKLPAHLRLNPIKTEKVAFSVYNFQPWQALSMHRHPGSDEIFYVVKGRSIFYVEDDKRAVGPGEAVYVPAGRDHAILSCGQCVTLISVQGPQPSTSIYGGGLEYFCPVCQLETPLTVGASPGDLRECPRCKTILRLTDAGEAFSVEIVEVTSPPEAHA